MKNVVLNNIGDFTEIACVLDRSGSMSSIKDDAIGGFNTFLNEQKEAEGDANMSIYLFDDQYTPLVEKQNVKEVEELTTTTFKPRGSTSLFDAIGKTVINLENKINDLDVKPKNVLVVILTDGGENTSTEFRSKDQIKTLIERKRGEGNWEFLFLAANQDAFGEATSYGMSKGNAMNFAASGDGVKSAYSKMSKSSTKFRSVTLDSYSRGIADTSNLMDEDE